MSNKKDAKRPKKRKPLTSKGSCYQWLFLFIVDYRRLFTNTETREDRTKDFLYVDDAGDGTQGLDGAPDVKSNQIAA